MCWSPDGKYLATGGEDDLITLWSFEHKKVVSRGEGHKSYVNAVAFDPYTTILPDSDDSLSADKPTSISNSPTLTSQSASTLGRSLTELGGGDRDITAYRLGSVGQDTQLCLWDLSGDALKLRRPFARTRSRVASRHAGHQSHSEAATTKSTVPQEDPTELNSVPQNNTKEVVSNHVDKSQGASSKKRSSVVSNGAESTPSISSQSSADKTSGKKDKKKKNKDKENKDKSEESVNSDGSKRKGSQWKDPMKKVLQFVGVSSSPHHNVGAMRCQVFESCNSDDIAPKMEEVNLIEPLVAKKISQERITCLVFREDCIVTATQEGFINTWARPDTDLPPEALGERNISEAMALPSNPGVSVCMCIVSL